MRRDLAGVLAQAHLGEQRRQVALHGRRLDALRGSWRAPARASRRGARRGRACRSSTRPRAGRRGASTIVASSCVERDRVVDAERRRRGVGAEADAVPDLALGVLRRGRASVGAAVAADARARRRARRSRSGSGSRCRGDTGGRCRCCAAARARSERWRRRRRPSRSAAAMRARRATKGEGIVALMASTVAAGARDCAVRDAGHRIQRRGNTMPMQYRRLGRSGLQVSELSLGSWVTYHNQVDVDGGHARCSPPRWTPASTSSTTPRSTRAARARS